LWATLQLEPILWGVVYVNVAQMVFAIWISWETLVGDPPRQSVRELAHSGRGVCMRFMVMSNQDLFATW
jgi:hypothetical protein